MYARELTVFDEYGGYYYLSKGDGTFLIRMPGSPGFVIALPNIELTKRFIDQCNQLFEAATKDLRLHLTGCKRCERSVGPGPFDPCQTGQPMLFQGKTLAQEITQTVANEYKAWLAGPDGRVQDHNRGIAEDSAKVSHIRSD